MLGYAEAMATRFSQVSEEYLRQIDAEVERLHQLRTQVQTILQNEVALEGADTAPKKRPYNRRVPLKTPEKAATKRSYVRRAPLPPAKKSAAKKRAAKKSTAKKTAAPDTTL